MSKLQAVALENRGPHSFLAAILAAILLPMAGVSAVDLTRAVVLAPPGLSRLEQKAVTLLVEEVEKRSQIRWEVRSDRPTHDAPIVALGQAAAFQGVAGLKPEMSENRSAEGFHLRVNPGAPASVTIVGNDPRGVLYGVGYLLRQLHLAPDRVTVADALSISTAPHYPLRGHQLGYRPKTHSYDAWNLATWEQYYRDQIVFGANAVELIPPRSDDDADSPHFPLPPLEMI